MLRWIALVLVACGGSPARSPTHPSAPHDELIARVGRKPRALATIALHDPAIAQWLDGIDTMLGERSFADCGLELAKLDRVRVAIGEPLVIAAEIDGAITADKVRCVLGGRLQTMLAVAQVEIHDRPGGISITRQVSQPAPISPRAQTLIARCAGKAVCGAVMLGPAGHELDVDVAVSGHSLTWRLGGPGLAHDTADAFAAAVTAEPELRGLVVHRAGDELVATFTEVTDVAVRDALKRDLLEAFRIPSSSMVPTLQLGDNVFALKGPLRGKLEPGAVVVHRHDAELYIKRIVAIGGQTVTETASGLEVDGVPLPTQDIDPSYHYIDRDPDMGHEYLDEGRLLRERLGSHSHLILRRNDGHPGSWTVPVGSYFLVGDNRDNSNDSRFQGAVREDAIVGRVIGIWLAMRDGAPDWNRMGTPVD